MSETKTIGRGRPRGTGGQAKVLDKEEIKRIIKILHNTTHEKRDLALFFICLGGGTRISEASHLLIKDVLNTDGTIKNQIRLEKWSTKNRKSRTIFLSDQAQKYLQEHIETLKNKEEDAPVFFSQKNCKEPLSSNVAINRIKTIFDMAGIKDASSHSMRRSFANTLKSLSVDIHTIQNLLGHSSLNTTQLYFSMDPVETGKVVAGLKF